MSAVDCAPQCAITGSGPAAYSATARFRSATVRRIPSPVVPRREQPVDPRVGEERRVRFEGRLVERRAAVPERRHRGRKDPSDHGLRLYSFRARLRPPVKSLLNLLLFVVALALPSAAVASEPLPDLNLSNLSLSVNAKGEALLRYTRDDGSNRQVLVWGGVDALAPSQDAPQVKFQYDFAGGWKKYRRAVAANVRHPLRRL